MKNKVSKFLSVLLALIMVMSILPLSSITASAETVSGTCGENLTWTFDDSTGVLTISGSGEMYDYYLNTVPWLNIKPNIQEIVFDGEITYIGSHAFCGFTNITSIDIPDSVKKIGQSAFADCTQLETVTIPDSVTYLDGHVFADCTNLKEATFGKGLTETGDSTFSGCERLKNVVIPDNIEVINDSTFWFCTGLESVAIPNSVTDIGSYAFEYCYSLKTVFIPESVASIGLYTFSHCTSLTEITVDENNKHFYNDEYGVLFSETRVLKQYPVGRIDEFYVVPYPIKIIGCGAFADSRLTGVALSNCTNSINSYAFESCNRLKTIYIKKDLKQVGYGAFMSCYKLDVYYSGPQSAGFSSSWENIEIDSYNSALTNASIHYDYTCKEHTFDKWYTVNNGCESKEREVQTCVYCSKGEYHFTGNVIEHEYLDWEIYKEPTCTNQGEELRYCEKCGEREEISYIDALGHAPAKAVEENYVAPAYSQIGSKDLVVYCSVCGEELSRKTVIIYSDNDKSFTGIHGDYFYKDGVRLNAYQLVEYDGNYYFINDSHKIAKNKTLYLSDRFVDGTQFKVGYYMFDADGKMLFLNGPVGDYFYKNNVRMNAYQLVEFDGDFYFINDSHKLAKNKTLYLSDRFVEGTQFKAGYYTFDADGKMLFLNGPVGDYFYKNNVRMNAYQLVEFDGDFYFINDSHKLAKDKRIYLSQRFVEGTDLKVGYYNFDADGKLIMQ